MSYRATLIRSEGVSINCNSLYSEPCSLDQQYEIGRGVATDGFALPHQESDFAFFEKNTHCGSLSRFQPAHHCTDSLSPKRQETDIMRFKGQIPGEATGGFSVMSVEVSYTGYFQGRRMWKAD